MAELSRNTIGQAFDGVAEAIAYPFEHPIKTVKAVGWGLLAANALNMARCAVEIGAEYLEDKRRIASRDS